MILKMNKYLSTTESNNVIQFSRHYPPKCANHIHSQRDHTELMITFCRSTSADWLERNDMDCFFRTFLGLCQYKPSKISEAVNFL